MNLLETLWGKRNFPLSDGCKAEIHPSDCDWEVSSFLADDAPSMCPTTGCFLRQDMAPLSRDYFLSVNYHWLLGQS